MSRVSRRILPAALVIATGLAVWHFRDPRETGRLAREAGPTNTAATVGPGTAALPSRVLAPGTEPVRDSSAGAFQEFPVDAPLIALAQKSGDPAALRSFRVRLRPDRFADVDVNRFDAINDEEGVYSGVVRGERDSQAVFSYVGLAYAGTVVLPAEEQAFYITATEDGRMRITALDLRRAPLCGQPLLAQGPVSPP